MRRSLESTLMSRFLSLKRNEQKSLLDNEKKMYFIYINVKMFFLLQEWAEVFDLRNWKDVLPSKEMKRSLSLTMKRRCLSPTWMWRSLSLKEMRECLWSEETSEYLWFLADLCSLKHQSHCSFLIAQISGLIFMRPSRWIDAESHFHASRPLNRRWISSSSCVRDGEHYNVSAFVRRCIIFHRTKNR